MILAAELAEKMVNAQDDRRTALPPQNGKTWPDEAVGRFYRVEHAPRGPYWSWTVAAFHARPTHETGPHHGTVDGSARDAARTPDPGHTGEGTGPGHRLGCE